MRQHQQTSTEPSEPLHQDRPLPHAIRIMWCVYLALAAVSVLWSRFNMFYGDPSVFPYQYYVLPLVTNRYDLLCFLPRFAFFGTQGFFTAPGQAFNYSPAMAAFLHGLFALPVHPYRVFTLVAALWMLAIGSLFVIALRTCGISRVTGSLLVFSMLLAGYPVVLTIYLGNLELFVWIPLAIGIWAYLTGRFWIAAICFAIPASLKYFPILFFGLLLSRRTSRQLVFGCGLTVLMLVASAWYMGPTFTAAIHGLQAQMVPFTNYYLLRWHPLEGGLDHSVYGLLKVAFLKTPLIHQLPLILRLYVPLMGLVLVLLFVFRIRKLPPINQVLALTVASITFSPLSHDYTLVHLYAALAAVILWLVSRPAGYVASRSVTAMLISFAILLAPITFIEHGASAFSGQLRCLVLLLVLVLSLSKKALFVPDNTSYGLAGGGTPAVAAAL